MVRSWAVLVVSGVLAAAAIGFGIWATVTQNSALFGRQTGLAGIYSLVLAAVVVAVPMAQWGIRRGQQSTKVTDERSLVRGIDAPTRWYASGAEPRHVNLLDLIGVGADPEAVEARWASHANHRLAFPVGVNHASQIVWLDMVTDGPCGTIVGYSGTGTSELLRTICVSAALTFHPERLRIHLIDFKGGGVWREIEKLPHVQSVHSSFGYERGAPAVNMLDAILRDKMHSLESSRSNDIDEHNAKVNDNPIPLDLVLVDEIAGNEVLLDELARIQHLGRALGACLVVGTARSRYLTSQFQALSRFTVSMGYLEDSDVPELPNNVLEAYRKVRESALGSLPTGRGIFIHSGYRVTPFQAAYCGKWEPEGAASLFLANKSLRAIVEAVQLAVAKRPAP
jgi:FtsK/SpoIIIE family